MGLDGGGDGTNECSSGLGLWVGIGVQSEGWPLGRYGPSRLSSFGTLAPVRPATRGLPAAACRHGVVMQCMGCNGCQPYVGPVGTHAACRLLATTRVGACAANHHHLTCLACGSRACATLCTCNLNVCTLCCCPYCLQGMGEPLSNYDAVKAAVTLMAEPREL